MINYNTFSRCDIPHGNQSVILTPSHEKKRNLQNNVNELSPIMGRNSSEIVKIQDRDVQELTFAPQELLSAVEQMHSNCQTNPSVINLVFLRKLIDQYHKAQPWCLCFCCSASPVEEADDFYHEAFIQLSQKKRSNVENLLLSYSNSSRVEELRLSDGIYTGEVLNGVPHGKGELKKVEEYTNNEESAVYKYICHFELSGSFQNGVFKMGTKVYPDGTLEEGVFKNNGLAKGFINDQDGTIYALKIEFQNGTYTGRWLNNQPHGSGTLTTLEGKIFEGIFINGHFQEEIIQDPAEPLKVNNEQRVILNQVRKRRALSVPIFSKKSNNKLDFIEDHNTEKNEKKVNENFLPSNVITNSPKQNGKPESEILIFTPSKTNGIQQINLKEAVNESAKKVLNYYKSPSKTPQKNIENCIIEIKDLAQGSCDLLDNETDSSVVKELILSGKKLEFGIDLVNKGLENSPNGSPYSRKNLISKFSELNELTDSQVSDYEWGSDCESDFDEERYEYEQSKIEWSKRSKSHEEFFYDEKVYAQMVNLRVIINSIEALKKLNHTSSFEERYHQAANKLKELMENSSILNEDQIGELLAKFPLDELNLLQEIYENKNTDLELTESCSHEILLEKRNIYRDEIQGWTKVFDRYTDVIGSLLKQRIQWLEENDSEVSSEFEFKNEIPFSPSKFETSKDV